MVDTREHNFTSRGHGSYVCTSLEHWSSGRLNHALQERQVRSVCTSDDDDDDAACRGKTTEQKQLCIK